MPGPVCNGASLIPSRTTIRAHSCRGNRTDRSRHHLYRLFRSHRDRQRRHCPPTCCSATRISGRRCGTSGCVSRPMFVRGAAGELMMSDDNAHPVRGLLCGQESPFDAARVSRSDGGTRLRPGDDYWRSLFGAMVAITPEAVPDLQVVPLSPGTYNSAFRDDLDGPSP